MDIGNGYVVSGDKAELDMARICEMLRSSYWAKKRSREAIQRSIENSLC